MNEDMKKSLAEYMADFANTKITFRPDSDENTDEIFRIIVDDSTSNNQFDLGTTTFGQNDTRLDRIVNMDAWDLRLDIFENQTRRTMIPDAHIAGIDVAMDSRNDKTVPKIQAKHEYSLLWFMTGNRDKRI